MNIIKKIVICIIAGSVILSCSKDNSIQFCEGVDNDGTGVRCGKKFTTGDLTGAINSGKPFETEDLTLKIIHIKKNSEIAEKTINLKVERDKNKANATLPFYNAGNYKVEVFRGDDLFAEGLVEIVDTL